ncbi:DUF86 domain-containing protein [candidate division KSB1 bacterium]|nr:DUF86 domain-containing protein [candidate division KSB1 bacterium]
MSKSAIDYLKHMHIETSFIIDETNPITENEFYNNETLKRAIIRSLEILGEATQNISNDFKQSHENIDWKNIARMRDKLIHHYFGIDYRIVWDVILN